LNFKSEASLALHGTFNLLQGASLFLTRRNFFSSSFDLFARVGVNTFAP